MLLRAPTSSGIHSITTHFDALMSAIFLVTHINQLDAPCINRFLFNNLYSRHVPPTQQGARKENTPPPPCINISRLSTWLMLWQCVRSGIPVCLLTSHQSRPGKSGIDSGFRWRILDGLRKSAGNPNHYPQKQTVQPGDTHIKKILIL